MNLLARVSAINRLGWKAETNFPRRFVANLPVVGLIYYFLGVAFDSRPITEGLLQHIVPTVLFVACFSVLQMAFTRILKAKRGNGG